MRLTSQEEILRAAIRKEADEAAFYRMAADRAVPGAKKAFQELAAEEEGHRKKLEKFDVKSINGMALKEVRGLGLSEILEDVPFSTDMSYADLLRMAIKSEEKSQKFYAAAAEVVPEPGLKKLLLVLAQEESVHKERLEKIYDAEILQEF